ncbi:hypothetical protein [Actinoplanes sp. NPDC089786]|uniref:hypothetical protein n=1 Tax=Actinoplanes sp. NPDC089786 TaxID=3155185 RepID=UPI0034321BBC
MPKDSRSPEEVFRLFIEQTEKMKKRRIFAHGIPRIAYKTNLGGRRHFFELSAPDEEDYRSFLMDLRPFLLNDESVHFESVHNLLYQRLSDENLKNICQNNRKQWSLVKRGVEVFNINGVTYAAIDFFFAVAYGEMFHLDEDKRRWLAGMPQSVRDWARFNVYSVGLNAAMVIGPQANLIRRALDIDAVNLSESQGRN